MLEKIENRLRLFLYSEAFKLLGNSLKKEISEYLLEWEIYRQVLEDWYSKKCEENNWNRFEDDIAWAAEESVVISSGPCGIYISLANPDEYVFEYGEYSNLIFTVKEEDLLYTILNYERIVREIKENIDEYMCDLLVNDLVTITKEN